MPGGAAPPKGVLLGSTPGGAIVYFEPPAAVPLNNELAAARGEAYAAEEAVLWRVTGAVMDVVDSLQHILDTVWLSVYRTGSQLVRLHSPNERGAHLRLFVSLRLAQTAT